MNVFTKFVTSITLPRICFLLPLFFEDSLFALVQMVNRMHIALFDFDLRAIATPTQTSPNPFTQQHSEKQRSTDVFCWGRCRNCYTGRPSQFYEVRLNALFELESSYLCIVLLPGMHLRIYFIKRLLGTFLLETWKSLSC